jgi:hypothetical protein
LPSAASLANDVISVQTATKAASDKINPVCLLPDAIVDLLARPSLITVTLDQPRAYCGINLNASLQGEQ